MLMGLEIRRAATVALACATLLSCSEDRLGRVFPSIRLCASIEDSSCTSPLSLGAYRVGESHETSVIVRNVGQGILEVESVLVLNGDFVASPPAGRIGPTRTGTITLTFSPQPGDNLGRVAVRSNDPERSSLAADIHVQGVEPDLVFCPTEGIEAVPARCSEALAVDAGVLRPGQVIDLPILVRNAGTAAVRLGGARIDDVSSVPGELSVVTSTGPGHLDAGADSVMVVRYRPLDGLPDTMTVTLLPDDPNVEGATLTVRGVAPTNTPPTALAVELDSRAATATIRAGSPIWIDGSDSSDPEGDPLRYRWAVVGAPLGSAAAPEHEAATRTRFLPDIAGAYGIQLGVTDSLGLVGYSDFSLTVEPRFGLTVRAEWSDPGGGTNAGDVDLHVLPTGAALFSSGDCFFECSARDWGVAGTDDDPIFRADVEAGAGIEAIDIPRPAAGAYEIFVNYFDAAGGRPVDATVAVFIDDELTELRNDSTQLTEPCETWHVGTLRWPEATLTLSPSPHATCCYGDASCVLFP